MRIKKSKFFQIICALLSAALLLAVIGFISARSEVKELEAEVLALTEENQQLSVLNQALQTQLNIQNNSLDGEYYCELIVDDWSQKNGTLTVEAFAQASLPAGSTPSARIELWRGSTVMESIPVTLNAGQTVGIFEAESSLSFHIPAIEAEEELELWLIVECGELNDLFTCGAGWYLEGNELMIIAG